MAERTDHKKIMREGGKLFLPSLSLDCVIFGFHNGQLKVLLLKMRHIKKWSLPGGFILLKEDPADAAERVLTERTGIEKLFLQQFQVFGMPDRSDASVHRQAMKKDGIKADDNHWLLQRFVTIGYYALVEFSDVSPLPDELSEA
jgi:ADP-ribose pyrophosphatase YjhB (NUDIX family)